jgi:diguanylate cyclase (GGDEF)-like protein
LSHIHPSVREVAVLQQATQMILSSLDADTVLHHMLLVVRNYFGASRSAIYLLENEELYCRAQSGDEQAGRRLPIGKQSLPGWVAFTRAPLYVPDVSKETRHRIEDPAARSVLVLPLLVRQHVLGVLEITSGQVNPFGPDAIGLLSVFAGQASIALENARLYSADLRRMRQIEIINLIARTAAAAHDTQQFFSMLLDLISDTFEGTMIAIVLAPVEGHLSIAASSAPVEAEIDHFVASRQRGLLAEAFSQRSLAVANDIPDRTDWPACFPDSGSELCAPLISLGEIMGALVLGHPRPNFFSHDDRTIAQAAGDVCATAARNLQLSEELRRVANLDSLTGLYNQRYFHNALAQEVSRARRHKKEFGLIMVDLCGFREINASLGVDAGDELLRRVATLLRSTLRNNDVICRYLGDRFGVFLPEVNADGVTVVAGKLQQALRTIEVPFPQATRPLSATWATAQFPADSESELELMKLLLGRLETSKKRSSSAKT